ncbi:hypothetical protein ACJW31_05G213900 [Castanea mollissima]
MSGGSSNNLVPVLSVCADGSSLQYFEDKNNRSRWQGLEKPNSNSGLGWPCNSGNGLGWPSSSSKLAILAAMGPRINCQTTLEWFLDNSISFFRDKRIFCPLASFANNFVM